MKQTREWNYKNPERRILTTVKARAKRQGIPFNLTLNDIDIPEYCPVLGIHIDRQVHKRFSNNSPSVDRIVPALGYVQGNIIIISNRANLLKKMQL